jgi:hypothetical protein
LTAIITARKSNAMAKSASVSPSKASLPARPLSTISFATLPITATNTVTTVISASI